jgi:hypothetical protein
MYGTGGKPEGMRFYEYQGVGGSVMLEWILDWGCMDWIDLAQDRDPCALVDTVINLQVHKRMLGKFLSSCTTGGFSRTQLHEVSSGALNMTFIRHKCPIH